MQQRLRLLATTPAELGRLRCPARPDVHGPTTLLVPEPGPPASSPGSEPSRITRHLSPASQQWDRKLACMHGDMRCCHETAPGRNSKQGWSRRL